MKLSLEITTKSNADEYNRKIIPVIFVQGRNSSRAYRSDRKKNTRTLKKIPPILTMKDVR